MKKPVLCIMAMGLLLAVQPLQSKAEPNATETSIVIPNEEKVATEEEVAVMLERLNEIKMMDHSTLNFKEKKALRKEVRNIQERTHNHGGVYISVGGAILIILLLILIF